MTILGEIPLEWVEKRMMGVATATGEYADICSSKWISRLRMALAGQLKRFGVYDSTVGVISRLVQSCRYCGGDIHVPEDWADVAENHKECAWYEAFGCEEILALNLSE